MEKKIQKKSVPSKVQKRKPAGNSWESLASSKWFIPLFLFLATLIVYINSLGVPFQFDDSIHLILRDNYHTLSFFKSIPNWFKVNERPFAFLTLALNYIINGEHVFGYHLVNLLIHFFSGLTLYYWLNLLPSVKNDNSRNKWFALVVALFFVVHPVQTQSVTYIIQRMSSLAGLGLLVSAYFYTKGRLKQVVTGNFRDSLLLYGIAFLAGVLGLLSKQNVVVFPLILLLIEYFFIRSSEGKIYTKYLITVLALGAVLLIGVLLFIGLPAETTAISRMQYFATQMTVIPRYFQMMLVPVGLSIDHGIKLADGLFQPLPLLGAAFLLALIVFAVVMAKKEPLFSFGIFWIFITLLVESSFFPITDPMFDHRMYLPVAGFAMALWSLADRYIFSRNGKLLKPVVLSVLILFSGMTVARNHVWGSRISIWEDVTVKYPDYFRGWQALGKMYMNQDAPDFAKSIECFEKAKTINPNQEENLVDLGFAYMSLRQEDNAMICYKQLAGSKNPEYREQALNVLSAYNSSKGNTVDAEKYIRELIALKPAEEKYWKTLFASFFDNKELEKAKAVASDWSSKFPASSDARFSMGKAFFYANERAKAGEYFLSALQLNPRNADAMMLYANVCVNTFEYDKAIDYLEKAYQINKNESIPGNINLIKQLKERVHR